MRFPYALQVVGPPDYRRPWRPPVRLIGLLEQVRTWPTRPFRTA
jgi:hypothetical protein